MSASDRSQSKSTREKPMANPQRKDAIAPPPTHAERFKKVWGTLSHHAKRHVGAGILCSVAYFDPGNWSVDLQAGSQFGYKLLFVVLTSGLCAVVLQVLAAKLGCVTGLDLAAHCRLLLNDHPRYPRLVRMAFLYPLYALSEIAIVSTDLAELLGSAIGLVLIFPKLPLSVAVMLTALDVIVILALDTKGRNKPLRALEVIIIILVGVVFCSFIVLIVKVSPQWSEVFEGYLPSKALIQPSGLYTSIGILGATVMPHALYLGSFMATQDRVSMTPDTLALPTSIPANNARPFVASLRRLFVVRRAHHGEGDEGKDLTTPYGERENNSIGFIRAHLSHGIADMVLSLLGFAVAINSAILVLSGAVFFFGPGKTNSNQAAGLFDAHDLIRDLVGKPAAFIFALALLCSGQSASITATLAGQIVSEGFIQWSISPFLRRLVTRCLGLIPSMAVAVAVGRPGIDTLLVISQVVLSIVLPFVMFPLVWLTSSSVVMRVKKPRELIIKEVGDRSSEKADDEDEQEPSSRQSMDIEVVPEGIVVNTLEEVDRGGDDSSDADSKEKDRDVNVVRLEAVGSGDDETDFVDYSNGWPLLILSYAIWVVVVVANGYLLVTLAID